MGPFRRRTNERGTMRSKIAPLALLLFAATLSFAASGCDGNGNCYVRAGATGTGTGANWTSACTSFTGSCDTSQSSARGVTFWVANGSYTCNFLAPDSGTLPVTIMGATATGHGPDSTTWQSGFAGQAVFAPCFIGSDYWTFNGQTRGADWQSGYTLKFSNVGQTYPFALGTNASSGIFTNWTFEYIEIEGSHTVGDAYTDEGFQCEPTCNNLYIGSSYIHHAGVDLLSTNYGPSSGTNHTLEYSWLAYNDYAQSAACEGPCHAQGWQTTASNLTVRYNVWQDIMSTAVISDATGASSDSVSNWYFYGNIVFWDSAFQAQSPNVFLGDGLIGFTGSDTGNGIYVYNNTIFGINSANGACNPSGIVGQPSTTVLNSAVENNLWGGTTIPSCDPHDQTFPGLTVDYNSYFDGTQPANDTSAHLQVSSSNPFVNATANTIAGFALTADTAAWTPLSTPFNNDMLGATRTSSRGALQFNGGGASGGGTGGTNDNFNVSVIPYGAGTVSGSNCTSGSYAPGTAYSCTATANTNYIFASWTDTCGGTTGSSDSGVINANCGITAFFNGTAFNLNTSASPLIGGSVSGGGAYAYGATFTLNATPSNWYQFSSWTGNCPGTALGSIFIGTMGTANCSEQAVFTFTPPLPGPPLCTLCLMSMLRPSEIGDRPRTGN
jgi:hypothetical protein